jgi:hypothetical protein
MKFQMCVKSEIELALKTCGFTHSLELNSDS